MKTPQQKKFEKLVTTMILNEPCIISKKVVLEDFRFDSDRYYDIFCDEIFEFSQEKSAGVFIDERGFTHSERGPWMNNHICLTLLTSEDLREDEDDIIIYIDLALNNMERTLSQFSPSFFIL